MLSIGPKSWTLDLARRRRVSEERNYHLHGRVSPQRRSAANLLKPTGYVMHRSINIRQLYAMPTLYLCVLYLSENKQ
jgi:hypothetical protein